METVWDDEGDAFEMIEQMRIGDDSIKDALGTEETDWPKLSSLLDTGDEFSRNSQLGFRALSPADREELAALVDIRIELNKAKEKKNQQLEEQAIPEGSNNQQVGFSQTNRNLQAASVCYSPFGESVYTMLYICSIRSRSFWYAIFVYCLQLTTILLTMVDIIDFENTGNRMQIPPMVDTAVTCSQAIALFMALAYQSDLIEAAIKFQDGFFPQLLKDHRGATYPKWWFACTAQLFAGVALLVASFVLTMQSSTVIDVMLNLTALLFMAEIDDIGFTMAKLGFLTTEIQKKAQLLGDIQVPVRQRKNWQRRLLYFLALMGLFTGYAILKNWQLSGHYLPTYIYVQFGDAYNSKIAYYSGIMKSDNGRYNGYREYRDMATLDILLSYCVDERSWTFSDAGGPCQYFAKSFETRSYDVTSIPYREWQVKGSDSRIHPFDSFSLVGQDCDQEKCMGTCGGNGLCQCPHDQFGLDCELHDVCQVLAIDDSFEVFPSIREIGEEKISIAISEEFEMLMDPVTKKFVKAYGMPVYYSNRSYPANIIFFGGRRWILTTEYDFFDFPQAFFERNPGAWFFTKKTVERLENNFHGHANATFTPLFASDPVDFETPGFKPTPIGLGWQTIKYTSQTKRDYRVDRSLNTFLVCKPSSCMGPNPEYGCVNGNCSKDTGTCICQVGYTGDRCEKRRPCYEEYFPCSRNGLCDQVSGSCRCNPPWFGANCEDARRCFERKGSCWNGGLCNVTTGLCDCPKDPAISGVACEKRADCEIFGCANGGVCGFNGACACRPPFYGTLCDMVNTTKRESFCSMDGDCMNGTCNVETGSCVCSNPASYGTLCEHSYNCSASITGRPGRCLNSGICNQETSICDCPAPYSGPDCSQVPRCLSDEDCGGVLFGVCDLPSGRCFCHDGPITGPLCENYEAVFAQNCEGQCYEGGTCEAFGSCQCTPGRVGSYCESFLAGQYDQNYDSRQIGFVNAIQHCGFEDPFCAEYCEEDATPQDCNYCLLQGFSRRHC